jgi:hypothetical protein
MTVLGQLIEADLARRVTSRSSLCVMDTRPGDYVVATMDHYVVVLIQRHLGSAGVAALERSSADVVRKHSRVGHLIVLFPERSAPGPDERAGISRVVRQYRDSIAGVALVREGGGLRATLTRSALAAINLVSQASHPSRVFSEVGDATVWLGSQLPRAAADAADLRPAIRELRRGFI